MADRTVVLPFENLTGDPSLDWVRPVAQTIVASDTSSARAATISDAYLSNATRLVHGSFTGHEGALRFSVEVEDASRHKMIQNVAVSGDVLAASNLVARELDGASRTFASKNPEAVAAWGRGDDERAVALDPSFGSAWLSWVEKLAAQGHGPEAIEIVDRALAQKSLQTDADRARLELLSATLRKDTDARLAALKKLSELTPSDLSVMQALADAALLARKYPEAVGYFREISRKDPANTPILLSLGYAEAYAGDLDAVKKTFEEYGTHAGQKANSYDSLGEAYFMNGRFADAEKQFLEANRADPSFLGGMPLMKAAYARWLAGDLKTADATMARYLDFRKKMRDPVVDWREGTWLYETGRGDEAMAKLAALPPDQKPLADHQIAAWKQPLPDQLDQLKEVYDRTSPASDGEVRTFYAAALIEAGKKDEAKSLLTRWPLPGEQRAESLAASRIFPTFIELRKSLGM